MKLRGSKVPKATSRPNNTILSKQRKQYQGVKAGTKSNEFLEPKKASLVEVACFRIDNAALSLKTKHLE